MADQHEVSEEGSVEEFPTLSDVRFESLEIDRRFGPFEEEISAELADSVRDEIVRSPVPSGAQTVPPAVYPLLFLRALRRAMGGIPPGSVLAGQEFEYHRAVPVNTVVTIEAWVSEKFVKKDRPYVRLEFLIRDREGRDALTGSKLIIWPQ